MEPILHSYPSHPWLAHWPLEPRGHGTAAREKNGGHSFRTLETVGQLTPDTEEMEWVLHVPIPQNSRINILFNGFCGYFNHRKRSCVAEVIVPEPGVVCGRFSDIPPPTLIAGRPIDHSRTHQWLDSDTAPVLLAIRENQFCLVTKHHLYTDAETLAERYLNEDLQARMSDELKHRAGAQTLFEQMHRHDSLAAIATEFLMKALRQPEGKINGIWSQSATSESPRFNINEAYPLALAWRHIDVAVAENLVRSILRLQGSSGAIPVHVSPHETFSTLEAPKPLLSKTAEAVWTIRKDPAFLNDVIRPLRRHLQWLLHHFNPKRRGQYSWQNAGELMVPDLYEPELATADLATLLITEIDALNRLRENEPQLSQTPPYFAEERDELEHNLQTQFWNENSADFTNAFIREKQIKIEGLPAFIPLLWRGLPERKKSALLSRIKETGVLPGGLSVLSWSKAEPEEKALPVLQQQLILETLIAADEQGSITHDFARITLQGFVEWHTLSVEEDQTLQLDPATAAYIINIQNTHYYRYFARGKISGFLFRILRKTRIDRFEVAVALLSLFILFSMHTAYTTLRAPMPFEVLEARMHSAYAYRDQVQIIENSLAIIEHYPDQAAMARLYAGNILLIKKDFAGAADQFEAVRKQHPDSPGPMIALGLAYQLQGQFPEANRTYYEFCYLFEQIFPEIVAEIQQYRILLQEGFRAPPKWPEIYRYQIMHEL